MSCCLVADRDGAIPGQSHIARGGIAGWVSQRTLAGFKHRFLLSHLGALISALFTVTALIKVFFLVTSRGGYMNTGTSQSLSGALNRQNQLMQNSGMQAGAFGRRYWALFCHEGHLGFVHVFKNKFCLDASSVQSWRRSSFFWWFLLFLFCLCVISCLYTFSSNYLVCTAQLSTHRTMLSHVITVLFIYVMNGLLDW